MRYATDCYNDIYYVVPELLLPVNPVEHALQTKSSAALPRVKNRSALQRIVLCVEYLGRLSIPLRGHRDSCHL